MKKLLLLSAVLGAAMPAAAQLSGDGYYRVKNYKTERYAYVVDDKGQLNTSTTNADVLAIDLWKDFVKASSDPATVLYISKVGSEYDVAAQGTSVHTFIDHYVSIAQSGTGVDNLPTYMCYARKSGAVKYLGDGRGVSGDEGEMSTNASGDYRKWYILPIENDKEERWFGIKPTVTADGKYYAPFFTGFPYQAYSEGVRFYTVSKIDGDIAVITPYEGVVPAGTGVIAECPNLLPTGNRLSIGGTGKTQTNLLGGVYFENYLKLHLNLTPYNPETMRLLSTDAQGHLAFVTGTIENLPANESYLKVPAGSPATLRVMTQAEYEAELARRPVSVTLSQSALTLVAGESASLTATVLPATADQGVTWTSSNPAVASVDENGNIKAVDKGTATITVTTTNNLTATCNVQVKAPAPSSVSIAPVELTLTEGESAPFTATVAPANAEYTLSWKVSDPGVARISPEGVLTAMSAGTATVTVSTDNGLSATAEVNVEARVIAVTGITLNVESLNLTEGSQARLLATVSPADATDRSVVWSSDNPSVASVDAEGMVSALSQGTATVTASASGFTALCLVTVAPDLPAVVYPEAIEITESAISLTKGESFTLEAVVTPDNVTDASVTWWSADSSVAEVGADGTVTAAGGGETVVTATTSNGLSAFCTVSVSVPLEKLVMNPSEIIAIVGSEIHVDAMAIPADATGVELEWSVSDPSVARIVTSGDNWCELAVTDTGSTVLEVRDSSGITGSATITGQSGIDTVLAPGTVSDVYNMQGVRVMRDADTEAVRRLPAGMYIIAGRKVIL